MASDSQKTGLLFKEFAGKVNARQDQLFTGPGNRYPFRNYVANNEIFSNDIPDDLANITFTYGGGATVYGLPALDASFASLSQPFGISYEIPNTDLIFYYKATLVNATPGSTPVRTWYIGDPSGGTNSLLRDSIPFSYDPSYNSYIPSLWNAAGTLSIPYYSATGGQIYWLMDYKSGFVQLYGTDSDLNTWYTNNGAPPLISFIKYTGPKGASGGGGSSGSLLVGESTSGIPGPTQDISALFFDDSDFSLSFGVTSATVNFIGSGGGGDSSFNNIDVSGQLNSFGDAYFNNVDISGVLTVSGDALFNTIDVSDVFVSTGDAYFNNVDISGILTVSGDALFNTVDVSDVFISSGDSYFNNVDISGIFVVSGDASFNEVAISDGSFVNVTVANDLDTRKLIVDTSASLPSQTIIDPIERVDSGREGYPLVQSYASHTIDASYISTGDWFTIARVGRSGSASNIRADAIFELTSPQSGVHHSLTFFATHKFGRGMAINILQNDWYNTSAGNTGISGLRIAYNDEGFTPVGLARGIYDGAALQAQVGSTANSWPVDIRIRSNDQYYGWDPVVDLCSNDPTFIVADNLPICITDTSRNGIIFDNLTHMNVQDLSWNPSGNNTNQITTNPIRTTSDLDVYGNTDISGSLNVGGIFELSGAMIVEGPSDFFGPTIFHEDALFLKEIQVDGSGIFLSNVLAARFDASNAYLTNVFSESITTTTLDASSATIGTFITDDISCNTVTAESILSTDISATNIDASANLTLGGIPVALRQETEFTFDPSLNNGDWVTIAQAGIATDRNSLRADGLFHIFENQASHHNSLVFRAGGKFSSGYYLNAIASSWFSSPSFTALRIASLSTYDGFVLQMQVEAPVVTVPAQKYFLKLYQDQNNDGWTNLIDGDGITADNTPTVYVTQSPSNPTGTPYSNFRVCGSLDWDPQGRNSIASTTQDYLFNGSYIDVSGGKLEVNNANLEMGTGDKIITGLVEATTGSMAISADTDMTVTGGADSQFSAGGRSGGQIGNMVIDANGNILVSAGVTKNGGSSSTALVDISSINQVYIHGDSSSGATVPSVLIGDVNNQHHTYVQEPLRLLNANLTDISNQFTQIGNPEGTLAYLTGEQGPIMQIGNYRRILTTSSTLMDFIASLAARTHATASSDAAQTIQSNTGSGQTYRFHMVNRGYGPTSGYLAAHGQTRDLYVAQVPHEMKVYSLTLYPFRSYANRPVITLTGTDALIHWEIWVATSTSSSLTDSVLSTTWFSNTWITNAGVPTTGPSVGNPSGITNDTNYTWEVDGCVCQRVSRATLPITASSTTSSIYNPWVSPTFSGAALNSNPITISVSPFTVPASTNFSVFLIERAEAIGGNTLSVNFHGSGSLGYQDGAAGTHDAVPNEVVLHGVSWLPIS
jgi:hypothetical protein